MADSLDNAPEHIQLAVDLIMLLEQHDLSPQTVLDALEIVKSDFQQKLAINNKMDN
ncbi:pleiotropic regulatory protein RsmS [Algicola sagamiensis]|uniref:pleiotropic regulatory protein RsmS n=1 Tax=Algicola sagamiensis TaxID=163869 RepID=UPI00035E3B6D|nr:pleiotropic regulatory protein RsmS [Algicola sagamiensis]